MKYQSLKGECVKEAFFKDHVTISGWVDDINIVGNKTFFWLRDWSGKIQCVIDGRKKIKRESLVKVKGKVVEDKRAKGGKEIRVENLEIISEPKETLPFYPNDRNKPSLPVRLDFRCIDLRREETKELMIARSKIVNTFRKFMLENGFVEIHPSLLLPLPSEGGTDVFHVEYFDTTVFLAQSPQFYKQLAVIGGLEKVFSTTFVFRAEKHDTAFHLNEIYQMDVEVAFATEDDVIQLGIDVLKEMGKAVDKNLEKVKVVTYKEVVEKLQQEGEEIDMGNDLSKKQEKMLNSLFDVDILVVKFYPKKIKPFYAYPLEEDERFTRSFDFFVNGIEVCSGTRRIHDYEMLKKSIEEKHLDLRQFKYYLEAFRYSPPPHSGFGMGLDRIIMAFFDLRDIREGVMLPRDRKRISP